MAEDKMNMLIEQAKSEWEWALDNDYPREEIKELYNKYEILENAYDEIFG